MIVRNAVESTRSRRGIRAGVLTAVLMAVLTFSAILPAASSSAAEVSSPYGLLLTQIDHTTPPARLAAMLDSAQRANAAWVRLDFFWYSAEWNRGAWNWTYFDTLVSLARARGLHIVGTLWGTPQWAATDGVFAYGVPNSAAWETFVAATAARYRGQVEVWEVWNEPDARFFWRGSPAQYAQLLAGAYTRIKAADPNARVALGGLAQGGGGLVSDFLQQVLGNASYPAGRYFDLHNIHTNFRTPSAIAAQIANNAAILSRYGVSKRIIATEASYTSESAYQTLSGYTGGQDGQARYLVDAYKAMVGNGLLIAVWATLADYTASPGPYSASGLTTTSLAPKQAYFAFQDIARRVTNPPPAPPSNLTIGSAAVTRIKRGSADVRWSTNAPADSMVKYGETSAVGSVVTNSSMVTSHSIRLRGLMARARYYVQMTSRAADGRSATSEVLSFVTH
jgi:polysaccharide biosynthesis protein PslG